MLCGAHPHARDNICMPCLTDLPWSKNGCSQCAKFLGGPKTDIQLVCLNCLTKPPLYQTTVCAFDYLVPINGLINQFKHQHNLAAGRLLTACLSQTIAQALYQGRALMPQLIIPVPLHSQRLRQRGFNQAQIIATGVSRCLKISLMTELSERVGQHIPQQGQSRQKRLTQMTDLFQIRRHNIDPTIQSIAIIDDVMTTGATAQALSRSLIDAWDGPLDIQIWCVARAQPPNALIDW